MIPVEHSFIKISYSYSIRGSEYSFGEENDAYVKWVTQPLLCAYEPNYTSIETNFQLLVPRTTPPPVKMGCQ